MEYEFHLFIPLNHMKLNEVIKLNDRITIYPTDFMKGNNLFKLDKKREAVFFYHNLLYIDNDLHARKMPKSIDKDHQAIYKLAYIDIGLTYDELNSNEEAEDFILGIYAGLRILDVLNNKYIERERLWSEWQRPYKYSHLALIKKADEEEVYAYKINSQKLCLDIDVDILRTQLIRLVDNLLVQKNPKIYRLFNLYNKIYSLIIRKNFKDANMMAIILLEYLYCSKKDEGKSDKIIKELCRVLDNEKYSKEGIEDIIKIAYRQRSTSVHKYKGVTPKSLYNFNLYYFNPVESLLEEDELDLFNLFLIVNNVVYQECLSKDNDI